MCNELNKSGVMDRININLLDWECAACPICTTNVSLDNAEKELYCQMRMKWGYDDNDINTYLNNGGDDREREKFLSHLCEEEEIIILNNGGIYYEDMDNN